jgi:hypothetical protein
MKKMKALLRFDDIEAALPAIVELHECGLKVEVLTSTDYYKDVLLTQSVWFVARGLYDRTDDEFFDWMNDFADRFDGVVEDGDMVEETRSADEIARIRSTNWSDADRAPLIAEIEQAIMGILNDAGDRGATLAEVSESLGSKSKT